MVDRSTSLSDSELDFTDEGVSLDSLPRHSHFFIPSSSTSPSPLPLPIEPVASNKRKLSLSLPEILVEGRIELPDVSSKREQSGRCGEEDAEEPVFSFDNRVGLAHDLGFLATMPELCDVTFLVGENRQPVCGVKAILAARSRLVSTLQDGNNTCLM